VAADSRRYREHYEKFGFSRTQRQAISWVNPGSTVLEVGCASGYIGRALIEEKACQVTGLELDPEAAREARANHLDVRQGSLEDPAFLASIHDRYDFVLATDVLEHLREPARVLNEFKRWLKPGGLAIISVPNIATWRIRYQLFFRGDFRYQETGILDRTHLHFFTWETLHELLAEQSWTIRGTMVERWELPVARKVLVELPRSLGKLLSRERAGHGVMRKLQRLLQHWAHDLQCGGERAVERVARRWPNLCASHIALLMSAAPAAVTSPVAGVQPLDREPSASAHG
jgi:methionine biosynthesis protein MetW